MHHCEANARNKAVCDKHDKPASHLLLGSLRMFAFWLIAATLDIRHCKCPNKQLQATSRVRTSSAECATDSNALSTARVLDSL